MSEQQIDSAVAQRGSGKYTTAILLVILAVGLFLATVTGLFF
jgi:hypothetical protein